MAETFSYVLYDIEILYCKICTNFRKFVLQKVHYGK